MKHITKSLILLWAGLMFIMLIEIAMMVHKVHAIVDEIDAVVDEIKIEFVDQGSQLAKEAADHLREEYSQEAKEIGEESWDQIKQRLADSGLLKEKE